MTSIRPITPQVITKVTNQTSIVKSMPTAKTNKIVQEKAIRSKRININSQNQDSDNFLKTLAIAIRQIIQVD